MEFEIREDSVVITGYVNAVERLSKPITDNLKGKITTFLERIKSGVFTRALKKNDEVKVLLNHNFNREVANTKDGSAKLYEDSIGLRAEATIKDKEVIEKAKNGELVGWSFGFYANDYDMTNEGNHVIRNVNDIDLVEVSILDSSRVPAYNGTSIDTREEKILCTRNMDMYDMQHDEVEKEAQMKHQEIELEKEKAEDEMLADIIVAKLLAKFDIRPKTIETIEIKQEPRSIDYSAYEDRLKNL